MTEEEQITYVKEDWENIKDLDYPSEAVHDD